MRLRVALLALFLFQDARSTRSCGAARRRSVIRRCVRGRTALRRVGQSRSVCITPVNEAPGKQSPRAARCVPRCARMAGRSVSDGGRNTSSVHGPPVLNGCRTGHGALDPAGHRQYFPTCAPANARPRWRVVCGGLEWLPHVHSLRGGRDSSPVRLRITKVRWASATPIAF